MCLEMRKPEKLDLSCWLQWQAWKGSFQDDNVIEMCISENQSIQSGLQAAEEEEGYGVFRVVKLL